MTEILQQYWYDLFSDSMRLNQELEFLIVGETFEINGVTYEIIEQDLKNNRWLIERI
tara:strand:+ start:2863 stop:3033 length:171 start_codon:yes stop_codon:yes gene_type:complete